MPDPNKKSSSLMRVAGGGSAVLVIACFLRVATLRKEAPNSLFWMMALAVFLLGTARAHLASMVLLMAAAAWPTRRIQPWVAAATATVAILAWMALAIPATIDFRIPREMGTGQVVAYYLGAPLQLVRVLAHTVTDGNMLNSYVASFLGVFFDQPLTHRTYAWLAGLVALVILPCLASPRRLLLAALAAACLAHAARSIYERRAMPVLLCAAIAAAVLVAPRTLPLQTRAENGTVRVGAVQGNVATDFEDAFNRALEVTGNHAKATKQLAADVGPGSLDMVIWPENSADLDPRDYPASATIVDEAAQAVQAPVLVGAVPVVDDIRYNDVLIWNPGDVSGKTAHPYYRKHRPVPFAEYIPSRSLVRRLTTQVDRVGIDMLPGTGPSTLTVPAVTQGRDVTFAMGICFEVAYDDALRTGVEQGGQAIIIPTNNASFLDSGEAAQQLAQGRVQAVVHGRSVIQASTVGYTAIINPRGEVEQVTRPYTQASLVADVPLRSSQTVADRLGAAPGIILLTGAGLLVGAGILSRLRSGRKAAAAAGDRRRRR